MRTSVRRLACLLPALLFSFMILAGGWSALAGETRSRLELYPLKGGALRYEGDRVTTEENGRVKVVTVYRKVGGKPLLREEWEYEQASLKLIFQKMTHLVSGQREDLVLEREMVKMLFQENSKEKAERDELKWDARMAYSAVLGDWIVQNWAKLEVGETVAFDLLVASRLETLGFRFNKDRMEQVGGEPVMVVRMEPSSWLIRKLVDPLYFFYIKNSPHKLLEYRGRSAIRKDNGETQDLRTVYLPVKG